MSNEYWTANEAPWDFRVSLPLIEDVIAFHGFRGRLRPEEREDFRSWVLEKLIENDYARLRKFQRRSSLRSFLSVVVAHFLVDYWQKQGVRRRPSSLARLFAPEGLWLERYLGSGYSLSEAVQMVRANHESPLSEEELFQIGLRLPPRRKPPKPVSDAVVERFATIDSSPERLLEERDEEDSRALVEQALDRAVGTLSRDERVYVRMRFEDGARINEIAKAFHLKEKPFYRRFRGTLRHLRRKLEDSGVDVGCLDLYREAQDRSGNFQARAV